MNKDMLSKTLIISIILLLFGISITPTIGISNSFDDTTPPVTTISYYPLEPDGENDWYISTVTVWLDATDDMSGVNNTYYSINSSDWEIYDTPIILADDSLYYITYFSVDVAGNMEFPKLTDIKVDQTPPILSLTYETSGNPLEGWYFNFTATATDHVSGMNRVEFYINDVLQETVVGSGPFYNWGFKYFSYPYISIKSYAIDNAGNDVSEEIINPKSLVRFPLLRLLERFPLLNLLLQRLRI